MNLDFLHDLMSFFDDSFELFRFRQGSNNICQVDHMPYIRFNDHQASMSSSSISLGTVMIVWVSTS